MGRGYKMLCIGPQWRGSNAGGLFRAFSRCGNIVDIIDDRYFISLTSAEKSLKVLSLALRPLQVRSFNNHILKTAESFNPDIVFVFKGTFVLPGTVSVLKKKCILVNFYPDVSFTAHGSLIPKTLPLYHHIFTTKTYGIIDMREKLGIKNSSFIPHGFDPDIHRSLKFNNFNTDKYKCDLSFIGGYSKKKGKHVSFIKASLPSLNIKVWGHKWQQYEGVPLGDAIQYDSITGDFYALAIQASKINLGLLHEEVRGASSGDKTTSRTFHIPGAGGFMVHERTDELLQFFHEDKEVICFSTLEELTEKVEYYLQNDKKRIEIQKQGTKRAWAEHKLDDRATEIVEFLMTKFYS